MSDTTIRYSAYRPKASSFRIKGVAIVISLHLLILWGLVAGAARQPQVAEKKPIDVVIVQAVIVPPPPSAPPKYIKPPDAPSVAAPQPPVVSPPTPPPVVAALEVASPAATTPKIVAAAPSAPTAALIAPLQPAAALAKPAVNRVDIQLVCPTQVQPEIPRRALRERLDGVVEARALIKDGAVRDVTILSGPPIFHEAVKAAMMQYKCAVDSAEIRATQEFVFNR